MLNFQQDGWQEDPLFEFLAPRALILPFLCCLCDLCLALPLLAVPKEPNTGCNVFVFVSQYFVRGCICGRGGRVCALAVSPGWPLAPSRSLPPTTTTTVSHGPEKVLARILLQLHHESTFPLSFGLGSLCILLGFIFWQFCFYQSLSRVLAPAFLFSPCPPLLQAVCPASRDGER